jgi:hypothetical protein
MGRPQTGEPEGPRKPVVSDSSAYLLNAKLHRSPTEVEMHLNQLVAG